MRGRIADLSFGMNRKQRLTLELEEDFRDSYDKLKDSDLEITVKKYRKKRSLDANAYAWAMIGKLAAKLQNTPNEVYRQYIQDIGDNFVLSPIPKEDIAEMDRLFCQGHIGRMTDDLGECQDIPGHHWVRFWKASSDFDTTQMARLIDFVVSDCKACGIETMTERELSLLKEG